MTEAPWSDVIEFWLGEDRGDALAVASAKGAMWWGGGEALDREISERFGARVEQAARGGLAEWRDDPHGRLALILLLDQFTRNVHRGTAEAFAADPLALELAREAVEDGTDARLQPIERVFLYMPFEHAEDLGAQDTAVRLFEALATEVPEAWRATFDNFTAFAVKHRDIIAQFGRFPHRNAVLGRVSTDAETAYLDAGGETFGQKPKASA
jgi:uncharacterized protein (DUF924 family)